jgi:hypothetical protein
MIRLAYGRVVGVIDSWAEAEAKSRIEGRDSHNEHRWMLSSCLEALNLERGKHSLAIEVLR